MILHFKLYSMLEKYRISELVKHLSFMLFSSFYPEVHRLLSNQTDPSIARNCFQILVCERVGWKKDTFHQIFKGVYCTQKPMTIGPTTSFSRVVHRCTPILSAFPKNSFLVAVTDSVLLHSDALS